MKAQASAAEVAVEKVGKGGSIRGMDSLADGGLVAPGLGGKGVEITGQAAWYVVEGGRWEILALYQNGDGDGCHDSIHIRKWTTANTSATTTRRDGKGRRCVGCRGEYDGTSVVKDTIARHRVIRSIEYGTAG